MKRLHAPEGEEMFRSLMVDQYAKGKGRTAEELLVEFGLPEDLLKQLRDAGLPPSAIHSLVVAAADVELLIPRVVIVVTLREPLKDEAKFRDKLKVHGRDPAKVEVSGIPLHMAESGDRVFVFALNEKDLATAKTPGCASARPGTSARTRPSGRPSRASAKSDC